MIDFRFWYLSFISCYWHPTTCQWEKIDEDAQINYDIWIVNGNPESTIRDNRFEYHFSFDLYDLVEIYSICILFYLFIPLPFVLIKIRSSIYLTHPILISYLLFQLFFFIGNTLNLIHYFIFAYNGIGVYLLVHIGNIITIIGESILILLLLFITKGKELQRFLVTNFGISRLVSEYTCSSSRQKDSNSFCIIYNSLLFVLSIKYNDNQSSYGFKSVSNICKLFFFIISLFSYALICL